MRLKKRFIICTDVVLLVVCFASPLFSQNDPQDTAVAPAFVRKIHGLGQSILAIRTRDGDYVTLSERERGLHVVRKTKPSGERVWEKSLSVQIVGLYDLTAITEVNKGYVIIGYKSNVWDYDNFPFALIVFLRPNGTVKWSKVFFENGRDISFDYVTPSPDGGFIVTAVIDPSSHPILVKFTSTGKKLWAKRFDNLSSPLVSHPSADNSLVLASSNRTDDGQLVDTSLMKVDQSGRVVWGTTLKMQPHSFLTLGHNLDNGTVLATNHAGTRILTLVGLRANGNVAWAANYSLPVSSFLISSVIPTKDVGHVVTGTTFVQTTGEAIDGFLIKIDAQRNLVFKKAFGYSGTQEKAVSIFARNANNYLVVGSSDTDLLFLSLNSNGVAPGCNFFRTFNVKQLDSPDIAISTPSIVESSPVFPAAEKTQLIERPSHQQSTIICQKNGTKN